MSALDFFESLAFGLAIVAVVVLVAGMTAPDDTDPPNKDEPW